MREPVRGEDELILKMEPIIARVCKRFTVFGYDAEDLMQEGRIAALKAIRHHDPVRCPTLEPWVYRCVMQQCSDLYRRANEPKQQFRWDTMSLDAPIEGGESDDAQWIDKVIDVFTLPPDEVYFAKMRLEAMRDACVKVRGKQGEALFDVMAGHDDWQGLCDRVGLEGKKMQNWKWKSIQGIRRDGAELAEVLDLNLPVYEEQETCNEC